MERLAAATSTTVLRFGRGHRVGGKPLARQFRDRPRRRRLTAPNAHDFRSQLVGCKRMRFVWILLSQQWPPPARTVTLRNGACKRVRDHLPRLRRPMTDKPARIAIVLMQKDEEDLLPVWLAYYTRFFKAENLFIIDNGSSSFAVKEHLRAAENRGSKVFFRPGRENFANKGPLVQGLSKDIADDYDIVIPIDCDEFIGVEVDKKPICIAKRVKDELQAFAESPATVAMIRGYFLNAPTTTKVRRRGNKKVAIKPHTDYVLNRGYHFPEKGIEGGFATNLCYLHFHFRPSVEHMRRSAHDKLPASVVKNPEGYFGGGWHMIQYLDMDEETYYKTFPEANIDIKNVFSRIFHNVPFSQSLPISRK